MVALKLVREAGAPGQDPDNVADAEGYLSIYEEVRQNVVPGWENLLSVPMNGTVEIRPFTGE